MEDDEMLIHDVEIKQPDIDLDGDIKSRYKHYKQGREFWKWALSFGTLGLGALYFYFNTKIVEYGKVGVRVSRDGQCIILPPGRHSNFPGESFLPSQSLSQPDVTLGPHRIVTIQDGYRGESYKQGKLVVLHPGRHLLDPQHILTNRISTGDDIINLGPKKIITVKAGFVGISYNKGILKLLNQGRHEVTLPDEVWKGFLSLQQEIIELPSLEIKTTDNINVTCHAVLNYRIVDPIKAITCVDNLKESVLKLAEVALSAVLRRFSYRDLSPVPIDEDEEEKEEVEDPKGKKKVRSSHFASKMQAHLHDEIHEDFESVVHAWGVEIIGPVQIKTLLPSDKRLKDAIAEMAINTAKADAQRRQAEFERQVKNTKAKAAKEAAILIAEGEAESKMIESRGHQQIQILDAKAEAEAIRLISLANLDATVNEARGAEALMKTPVAQQLALLDKQAEILIKCKTPVYVPSSDLGITNIWDKADQNPTTSSKVILSNSQLPIQ